MARRTWWKVGALLAAMMVFLTMLPATALAAAPSGQVLYVGGVQISTTGYWTTESDGSVTPYTEGGIPSDSYIHYDADTNILTLRNATIKKELGYSDSIEGGTYINGSAIGVFNQNGNAELTIKLQGQENTLSETSTGIHVYSHSGTASLTITGSGSLNASGFANPGISVQSNNGDATLTIQNAEVTATSTHSDGVRVLTAAYKSASLTVDGGSLTATATGSNSGIYFQFVSGVSGSGTPRLTVCGNTIVKASGDTGGITSNSSTVTPSGTGIVFNNGTGTVYGSVTLQEDLTIGEGESLTLDNGASLNTNGHNVIVDGGTLGEGFNLGDSVIYKVTKVELNKTSLTLNVGDEETLISTIAPNNATDKFVTWESSAPGVATVDTSGKVTAMSAGTATITVTTKDGNKTATCAVTVAAATVPVTGVTLSQTQAHLYYNGTPNTLALTATVAPDNATDKAVAWTSSNSAVATVDGGGNVTAVAPGTATIAATADGGKTATCLVTVTGVYVPPRPTGPDWGDVAGYISDAEPGSTVEVDMGGKTVLPGEVLDELAGSDVTLALDMGDGLFWEIYGGDVPADAEYDDVDLSVALGGDDIPADVANLVTGESGSVQVSLEHDGPFGFELTLVAPLGEDAAGLVANLYRFDDEAGSLGYEATAQVDGEGVARLPFDHASSWLVALDSRGHALPFPDALEGAWYSEAVRWAWLGGVMTGYGDGSGLFGTSSALTRAEAAVVLWRLAGEPEGASGLPADCDPSGFYAEAASWALGAGVFSGYSGDAFGPADAITREQLATVLWRAAGSPEAGGDLSSFSDAADVSGFADVAMRWAVSAGVLRGQGDGDALDPQGACTRAQLATMLYRLAAAE